MQRDGYASMRCEAVVSAVGRGVSATERLGSDTYLPLIETTQSLCVVRLDLHQGGLYYIYLVLAASKQNKHTRGHLFTRFTEDPTALTASLLVPLEMELGN